MDRNIPLYIVFLIVFLGVITTVLFGAGVHHVMTGSKQLGSFGEGLLTVAEFPSLATEAINELKAGTKLVTKNRYPELDGFKKSGEIQAGVKEDDGYLLLSSYDKDVGQSTVELIRIKDQTVIHKWVPDIAELTRLDTAKSEHKKKLVKSSFRMVNPLLLNNGDLVFQDRAALFEIDLCSKVNWSVDGVFHHSIELDAAGNIWAPSILEPSSFDGKLTFRDDAISQISPQGELLFIKSIAKILEENGYLGLLAASFKVDPVHLNDIQPALTDSKFWKKDDLFLSSRNNSTVMLYRPSTNKIIWLRTGPWLNQHDVNFVGDHEITVFGNDVIDSPPRKNAKATRRVLINGHNNVYRYNFLTDTMSTPFNDIMKSMKVRSKTESRATLLENGDVFIEEQNNGRILRLSTTDSKWEYARRINKKQLAMLSWSRYLTQQQLEPVLPLLQNASCSN